jgi:adenylate cyclase
MAGLTLMVSGTDASDVTGQPLDRRKLIVVVHADMVGYSRLIGLDDVGTLDRMRRLRREVIDPAMAAYGGRIVHTGGDALLIVFDSVDGAVRCALRVQEQVPAVDGNAPFDRAISFRIGINVGDVIPDGTDVHGDVVNVAARLQAECSPGGICVSRAVRDHMHDRPDIAFDALGSLNLKNIAHPVEAFMLRAATTAETMSSVGRSLLHGGGALPIPDKPSIAVLPFQNMSGDPEQEYFADGMVEEITTALSRARSLFVIARNSAFTYKGRAVDVRQVGRELGVRYVLEGSVRKAGSRVRISGQLVEAATGVHLWADRFEGSLADVFELQDKVAISVAGVIEPTLQVAEMRRSAARSAIDLTAYDLYLRALAVFFPVAKERIFVALGLLEQAIEIDQKYALALAWAANCHARLIVDGWAEDPETSRRKAGDFARQALLGAENDPSILANSAFVLAGLGEDIDAMIGLVDRALALNPSFARGWYLSGFLRLWSGQPDLAIEHLETSLRLSPRERMGMPLSIMGQAYFLKRQFDEAASKLLLSIQDNPGSSHSYRALAACYAHMGRLSDAREVVRQLRAITSEIVPDATYLRNPKDRELFLSGLHLATGEVT